MTFCMNCNEFKSILIAWLRLQTAEFKPILLILVLIFSTSSLIPLKPLMRNQGKTSVLYYKTWNKSAKSSWEYSDSSFCIY